MKTNRKGSDFAPLLYYMYHQITDYRFLWRKSVMSW